MKCLLGTRGDSVSLVSAYVLRLAVMGGGLISLLLSCCERNAFKACCGGGIEAIVLTLGFCGSAVGVRAIWTGTYFALVDAAAL